MNSSSKLFLVFVVLLASARADWKAGVGRADITPTEPIWMAGFGARTRPSEGVRQKIWVKTLALEDETGAKAVLVTSDLLGFNRKMADFVADQVKSKYGLTRDRLAINSSHTHSGPVTDEVLRPGYPWNKEQKARQVTVIDRYTKKLLEQVVEAVGAALADLKPATLTFAQGNAGFATNRRRVTLRHQPGPVDQDVPVLAVRGADGKVRAVVFGYACHATSMHDNLISGDWPGYAQSAIEEANPGATALFVNGASGDANPLPRRTVELGIGYGNLLAEAVSQVMARKMSPVTGPLKTAFETVDLAFDQVPTKEELERRVASKDGSASRHAQFVLDHLKPDGKVWTTYPYPIEVWQFGKSLKMVILGGELVVDYSLRLKALYGWENTWVAGYSNDVFAYIPSLRVLKEGGYEGGGAMIGYGQPGPFQPTVEETIVDRVEKLVRQTTVP